MSYPKWVFKNSERRLVQTPEEEKQLGAGWDETPDPNDKPEKKAADKHEDDDKHKKK